MNTNKYFLIISRPVLLGVINVWKKRYRGNQNTHWMFNIFLFRKSCLLCENVEKYGKARQATVDIMAHADFMLDT